MVSIELTVFVIASILLMILGVAGNAISIFIFITTKELKEHSSTFYFICVCILNIIISLYLPFVVMPSVTEMAAISCKIYLELLVIFPKLKAWLLVFTSLDRLLIILAPTKFNFIKKLKFQIISIFITILIAILLSVPYIIYFTAAKNSQNQTVCSASSNCLWCYNYFKIEFVIFKTVIPFLIMITSSSIIIWKMCVKRNILASDFNNKEKQLTKIMIIMDLSFIIFQLPLVLHLVTIDTYNKIIFDFTYSILYILSQIYIILSIVVFMLCSKIFYKRFLNIILKHRSRVSNHQ